MRVRRLLGLALVLAFFVPTPAAGQGGLDGAGLSRAGEAFHWIRKLQTTGSVLQITAHPDDENAGLLALLSRGHGVRTALLSLTRGEAGANAIGPELFDGLGWIRAAEMEAAGRWYGLDRVYFTPLVDYGYSKSLEESLRSWDEDAAAADVVEIIRRERPMVVLARFVGAPRDGHGQHQFAGRIARRAFAGAPDTFAFPTREGRRAQLPAAYFRRAAPDDDAFEIPLGGSRPWLTRSFAGYGAVGLSLQRSQTRGVLRDTASPRPARLLGPEPDSDTGSDLLALLSPAAASLSARFAGTVPGRLLEILERLDSLFRAAQDEFDWEAPAASLPRLGEALAVLRDLLGERSPSGFFDVRHELDRKEEQLTRAIRAAAGVSFAALARPPDAPAAARPFAAPPTLGPLTPGQTFEVVAHARAVAPASVVAITLDLPGSVESTTPIEEASGFARRFRARIADDAPTFEPHIERDGLGESRYRTPGDWTLAAPPPPVTASLSLSIPTGATGEEVEVVVTEGVERLEANLPYGHERREVEILPPVSVAFDPDFTALPAEAGPVSFTARIRAVGHRPGTFRVRLDLPEGFRADPAEVSVDLGGAGGQAELRFEVSASGPSAGQYRIGAALLDPAGNPAPAVGHHRIAHRDLPLRYLVRPAALRVTVLPVTLPEGLQVGYVAGAGDRVPEAIEALGAEVTLLEEAALVGRDLARFDAIFTGTRAYAVRPDLVRANQRLLDYARAGGHLVVLYNTNELIPAEHAPFPGELLRSAEEVSEEDSPVTILAPEHPLLTSPNRIGASDFEGWVEQRGSKFWSAWDPAYVPLFETQDTGQAPQRGGALTAEVGAGRYTYFAYALHRQLPEGVPGAFRLLANLIAAGQ